MEHATVYKCKDGYYVTYNTSKTFRSKKSLDEWLSKNNLKEQMVGMGFVHYLKRSDK